MKAAGHRTGALMCPSASVPSHPWHQLCIIVLILWRFAFKRGLFAELLSSVIQI